MRAISGRIRIRKICPFLPPNLNPDFFQIGYNLATLNELIFKFKVYEIFI